MEEIERQYHEVASAFPLIQEKEFASLRASIAEGYKKECGPIWLDKTGKIIDGRNRHRACIETGTVPYFETYQGTDIVKFVIKQNIERRHLNESQRAMVAAKLANIRLGDFIGNQYVGSANLQTPPISQAEAAKLMKVSTRSVANAKQVVQHGIPDLAQAVESGEIAVSKGAKIAKMAPEEQEIEIKKPHVTHNTGEHEWYTPIEFINAATEVMTKIDLDPASCEKANTTVKAEKYYSVDDDGLTKEWAGRIWLNPPYDTKTIKKFANKLAVHYRRGDVTEAIVLINNATETKWFNTVINIASAVIFPITRIKFNRPDGSFGAPLQGQAIIYIGNNKDTFLRIFSSFGWGAEVAKNG